MQWQTAEDSAGTATKEFTIDPEGKRKITGAIWLPAKINPKLPLILFGHGASGDRYQAPISHLARRFMSEGFTVLSLDGPVHGLRQVENGGREAFWPEYQRASCLDDMVDDWQLAISEIRASGQINFTGTAYFGLSMGSIFGIPLLAARNDVVVATLGLIGVNDNNPHQKQLLDSAAAIQCPLLFLMQMEDELFERAGYIKVFDAFTSRDKRIHANPGRHPEIPADEINFAFDFMLSHIQGKGTRIVTNPLAE